MTILVIYIAMTVLCYYMAEKRGRSPMLGVVSGLLFGIFGALYYLAAGDSPELRKQKRMQEMAEALRAHGK